MKFFLYTMAGSAFLFVGDPDPRRSCTRARPGNLTFDYRVLMEWNGLRRRRPRRGCSSAFMVAFAVKVPLFPFHTWLPDAHTEAPTAGSVVLAGVLLKMGTYGFLRFSFPLFPQASVDLAPLLLVLAVIGIIYGAIVAAMQPRPETPHRVLVGRAPRLRRARHLRAHDAGPRRRASFTMLSHGLTTGALFLLVGMLYERTHTRIMSELHGLWKAAPVLGGLFVSRRSRRSACPGLSGFVGEFLALLGTFLIHRWYAVVATIGVILAAVYMLWAFQQSFTGEPEGREREADATSTSARSVAVVPLLAAQRVPRPLPEAGARPGRADDEGAHRARRGAHRLSRAATDGRRRPSCAPSAPRAGTDIHGRAGDTGADRRAHRADVDWLAIAPADRAVRRRDRDRAAADARPAQPPRLHGVARHRTRGPDLDRGPPRRPVARRRRRRAQLDDGGHGAPSTASACSSARSCSSRPLLALLLSSGYLAARTARRAGVLRARAAVRDGHDGDGERQRPHRRVPRARDPVDRAVRARRVRPAPARVAGSRPQVLRARRVLVGGVPLRHRARLRRDRHDVTHRDRRLPRPQHAARRRACSCSASRCCSSASASRSRPRRSTCGRPTCTRARPRRSPRSWRRPRRPRRSRRCCGSSSGRSRCYGVDWRPAIGGSRGAVAASSAASPRSCRPT